MLKISKYPIGLVHNRFPSANENYEKASHSFVVRHLLVNTLQLDLSCVRIL